MNIDQLNVLSAKPRRLREAVAEMTPAELFEAEAAFTAMAINLGKPKYVCRAHAAVLNRLHQIYPTR